MLFVGSAPSLRKDTLEAGLQLDSYVECFWARAVLVCVWYTANPALKLSADTRHVLCHMLLLHQQTRHQKSERFTPHGDPLRPFEPLGGDAAIDLNGILLPD